MNHQKRSSHPANRTSSIDRIAELIPDMPKGVRQMILEKIVAAIEEIETDYQTQFEKGYEEAYKIIRHLHERLAAAEKDVKETTVVEIQADTIKLGGLTIKNGERTELYLDGVLLDPAFHRINKLVDALK